jgi:acyl carrier protein
MSTQPNNRIEEILRECLKQIAGDKCPDDWNPDDDVIGRCCLDSLHGVELACDLASRLKIDIPLKDNPLVEDGDDGGRKRARSYSEVMDYLVRLSSSRTPSI